MSTKIKLHESVTEVLQQAWNERLSRNKKEWGERLLANDSKVNKDLMQNYGGRDESETTLDLNELKYVTDSLFDLISVNIENLFPQYFSKEINLLNAELPSLLARLSINNFYGFEYEGNTLYKDSLSLKMNERFYQDYPRIEASYENRKEFGAYFNIEDRYTSLSFCNLSFLNNEYFNAKEKLAPRKINKYPVKNNFYSNLNLGYRFDLSKRGFIDWFVVKGRAVDREGNSMSDARNPNHYERWTHYHNLQPYDGLTFFNVMNKNLQSSEPINRNFNDDEKSKIIETMSRPWELAYTYIEKKDYKG